MASFVPALLAAPARRRFLPGFLRAGYALLVKRGLGLFKRPMVAEIPGIGAMKLEPWDLIDSRLLFFGVWEPAVSRFMREAIKPGAIVADIGANIGYYTLRLSRAVGPEGRVYAVEPGPAIRARLEDALARNAITNVTVIPYGISDRSERRAFEQASANLGASKFGEVSEDGIELRRLADVIPAEDLARLSFIKLDVEGMEAPVMRDLAGMLGELPRELTICAELRIDPEMQEMLAQFRTAGFAFRELPNRYTMFDYPDHPLEAVEIETPDTGQLDLALVRR
jgi:FkbM family methyltransferase